MESWKIEEITQKEAEQRAYACAQKLISKLNELNAQVAEIEKEEQRDLSRAVDFFTSIFVQVIGDRYIIRPDD
jgi:hypothetical protein